MNKGREYVERIRMAGPQSFEAVVSPRGDDATGFVGGLPFATPTAAAVALRSASGTLMTIESGTYIAQNLLFDGGTIRCEDDVILQTGSTNDMFENTTTTYDGINFQVVGSPSLEKVGPKFVFNMTSALLSFKIEADVLEGFDQLYAEIIDVKCNHIDASNTSTPTIFGVNMSFKVDYFIPSSRITFNYIANINSTINHHMNLDIDYLDAVDTEFGTWCFSIDGFNDLFDTVSYMNVKDGLYGNVTTFSRPLYAVDSSIGTATSDNKVYLSGEGVNIPTIINDASSKDVIVSGIFNCRNEGITGGTMTLRDLTINCYDNSQVISAGTFDVIGILTMVSTFDPKVNVAATLTQISEPDQTPQNGTGMTIDLTNPHKPIYNVDENNSVGGNISGEYKFSTSLTSPAATGKVNYDNIVQLSSTEVYVSTLTDEGSEIGDILRAFVKAGDIFCVFDRTDSGQRQLWIIDTIVDNTTSFDYAVTPYDDLGASFTNNAKLACVWFTSVNAPRKDVTPIAVDTIITTAYDMVVVDSTTADVTITLPTAVGIKGKEFIIKKTVAANNVIIDGDGTETIDGTTTKTLTAQHEFNTVISDNTNWQIIGKG